MLHRHTQKNIALNLPYPKIEKTVPEFLTPDPYSRLICHFSEQPDSSMGLRNLIIIKLHITTKHDFVETIPI
jgi:site-specific recombinase XerD